MRRRQCFIVDPWPGATERPAPEGLYSYNTAGGWRITGDRPLLPAQWPALERRARELLDRKEYDRPDLRGMAQKEYPELGERGPRRLFRGRGRT
jgi:hypothetical protein